MRLFRRAAPHLVRAPGEELDRAVHRALAAKAAYADYVTGIGFPPESALRRALVELDEARAALEAAHRAIGGEL